MIENKKIALIVGAGEGLSASLARKLSFAGLQIALDARNTAKLAGVMGETGVLAFSCDDSDPTHVVRLFDEVQGGLGVPDVVIYNASARIRGPITELDPMDVQRTLAVIAFGGFLVGQQAARVMVKRGSGVILFTGASASVKGYAQSGPFAMAKFALRGQAQSMTRELGPQGVYVAHIVIDGRILSSSRPDPADRPMGISTRMRSPKSTFLSSPRRAALGPTSLRFVRG